MVEAERTRLFPPKTEGVGADLRRSGVLLIDCDDERLERRYMETGWLHPPAGDPPIVDGIWFERQVFLPCATALIW
jgi:RNase adaptor protein for sRNA GlmZ degradation